MNIELEAKEFAIKAHCGQVRKSDKEKPITDININIIVTINIYLDLLLLFIILIVFINFSFN